MNLIKSIILIVIILLTGCNQLNKWPNMNIDKPLKTVEYVDLEKYMGKWYVIANIPTFIEKRATNAIENYKLNDNGEVETTFTFYQDSPIGKKKEYNPKGYVFNKETNAEWRMQFIWPFKMPFLIIDLDKNYTYTVIGYPNRNYVWIMSREPKMTSEIFDKILKNLLSVGYDISKIKKVLQDWE